MNNEEEHQIAEWKPVLPTYTFIPLFLKLQYFQ